MTTDHLETPRYRGRAQNSARDLEHENVHFDRVDRATALADFAGPTESTSLLEAALEGLDAMRLERDAEQDSLEVAGDGGGGSSLLEPPPSRRLSKKALRCIARRRSAAIHAYVGANGSSKSALAVMDSLPVLDGQPWVCENAGHRHTQEGITSGMRKVLSTVPLLDERTGLPHPLYIPLTEWHQVLHAEHCDLLFDEVTGIAGAREAMGMPVAVQNVLQQLRRRDCLLRWTAPAWGRADSIIRSCTIAVTVCKGYMPDKKVLRGENPPAWVPKRLFRARTFSAIDFDEWTSAKAKQDSTGTSKMRPMVVQWWWGPGSRVFRAYNTLDAVSRVGEVLDGGRCAHCGGRRDVPRCKC